MKEVKEREGYNMRSGYLTSCKDTGWDIEEYEVNTEILPGFPSKPIEGLRTYDMETKTWSQGYSIASDCVHGCTCNQWNNIV